MVESTWLYRCCRCHHHQDHPDELRGQFPCGQAETRRKGWNTFLLAHCVVPHAFGLVRWLDPWFHIRPTRVVRGGTPLSPNSEQNNAKIAELCGEFGGRGDRNIPHTSRKLRG